MKLSIAFTSLISLFAISASAGGGAHPSTAPQGIQRLEQLDTAAQVLMYSADHSGSHCGIASNEAKVLLQALEAQVRPLLEKEASLRLKQSRARDAKLGETAWLGHCQKACHCGLYARILEKAADFSGDQGLRSSDQELLNQLQEKASSLSEKQMESCVTAAQWFCKSSLLRTLRKATSEFRPANASY